MEHLRKMWHTLGVFGKLYKFVVAYGCGTGGYACCACLRSRFRGFAVCMFVDRVVPCALLLAAILQTTFVTLLMYM